MAELQTVADYFLLALASDSENDITHMKLQKLCAYAQGLSLGIFSRPLFEDTIEAWEHGPVVQTLYDEYKHFGDAPIPAPSLDMNELLSQLTNDERFILELAKHYYGDYAAHALRNRSHMEFPGDWGSSEPISKKAIYEHFIKDAMVKKLLEQSTSGKFDPEHDTLVDAKEIWDALEI